MRILGRVSCFSVDDVAPDAVVVDEEEYVVVAAVTELLLASAS